MGYRFFVLLLIIFIGSFYCFGSDKRVLIVPFLAKTKEGLKFEGGAYSYSVALSMWATIRFVSGFYFDRPTNYLGFDVNNLPSVTNRGDYDFYLVGIYERKGNRVVYEIRIYDKLGEMVWKDAFGSDINDEEELFDVADNLALKFSSGLTGKDIKLGRIVFKDFDLGSDKYHIEINRKFYKEVSGKYNDILRLPSGSYRIVVSNVSKGRVGRVFDFSITGNEEKILSFRGGEGFVRVHIDHKERGIEDYDIYVDGIHAEEGRWVYVIGDREISIVVSNYRGEVYRGMHYVEGEERNTVRVYDSSWGKHFRVKVGSGGLGMINVGGSYFFSRYFEMGFSFGFTPVEMILNVKGIHLYNASLISKYYVYGDSGSGLNFNIFGGIGVYPISFNNFESFGFDVFGSFLGVGVGYNLNAIGIPILIDLGVGVVGNGFIVGDNVMFFIGPLFNLSFIY